MQVKIDWLWIIVAGLSFWLAVWLLGCATSLMSREPVTQTIMVQATPDVAYQRALLTLARMGGSLTYSDPAQHLVTGNINGIVVLTVQIVAAPNGSSVTVHGVLLPGQLVLPGVGMTEVKEYCDLYSQERAANGR